MARIRSVKPEFWLDRKLARKLSRDERMLYMGLWNQADEHGRALGDPVVVKGAVFPYDDDLTVAVIDRMLDTLDLVGVVQRYEVDGDPYLFLPKLKDHQRLEPGKSKSKHPEPPARVDPPDSEVVPDRSEKTVAVSGLVSESVSEVVPEIGNEIASFAPDQSEHANPSDATIFSDESAQDPGKKSLLYGSWSMEQGGVSQTVPRKPSPQPRTSTESPPPPTCPAHKVFDPDCADCVTTSLDRENWLRELLVATEPSRFCARHPGGTDAPCRDCQTARELHGLWTRGRKEALEARRRADAAEQSAAAWEAAELRAAAIASCPLGCGVAEPSGYLNGRVCDHDPDSAERAARHLAKIRANLAAQRASASTDPETPPDPSPSVSVPTGRSESAPHDEPTTQENQIHA